jgi:hypothetical protein
VVSSSSANLTSSAVTSVDPLDPQAIIRSKLQSLQGVAGKDSSGSLTLAQRLISLPQSDWSSARIFRNLLRELFELPERKISRETVDVFRKVLVHHANFYNVEETALQDGGDDQGSQNQRQKQEADKKERDEWAEFVDIQNVCMYVGVTCTYLHTYILSYIHCMHKYIHTYYIHTYVHTYIHTIKVFIPIGAPLIKAYVHTYIHYIPIWQLFPFQRS